MGFTSSVESGWRDLRYAGRLLRLNPGFTAVAILSLALGVGANTAIFQLLNALRIRSLPVAHPEQLDEVRLIGDPSNDGAFDGTHPALTNPLWERIRERQQAFSHVFAWGTTEFELSSGGESRQAQGLRASGDFFDALGVRPFAGRVFTTADDRRGCESPPAVISYGFWQRAFGGNASAIGTAVTLDGRSYDIIGVTPPGFFGVEVGRSFDVAVPLCAEAFARGARLDRNDAWFLGVIGRLKPGWTAERATAHLIALSPPMFKETLPNYQPESERRYLAFRLGAFPAATGVSSLRAEYESPLWLLLATTALVLLVACANLANLMLARATARGREIAVRLALGASRLRIGRQLLAESALIAAAGAGVGAVMAQSLVRWVAAALTTEKDPVFVDVAGDARVFAFVAVVAAAACAIFGVIPAIRATAANPGAAMKSGGRGSTEGRERFGLRRVFVVAQVALSLVLVIGALLFVRSLRNLITADPGFDRRDILVASLDLRSTGLSDQRLKASAADLLERLRRTPGVEDAAQVRNVPVGHSFSNRNILIDGVLRNEIVNYNSITDRYFSTMGAALLAGRDFDAGDTEQSTRVAIVTASFARVFFGGADPIGRTFQIDTAPGKPRPAYHIVGVARDAKYNDIRQPFEPLIYVPAAQDDFSRASPRFVIRSRAPSAATAAVVELARAIHPATVVTFRTMEGQVSDSLVRERLMATLSGFFGLLGVAIAVIGLYGVMSYSVATRRGEIGIRIALGADRGEVIAMIMREAGVLLAIGIAIGSVAALAAGRAAAALLFGLKPYDPVTLAAAIAALIAVAAAASGVPAWRAARIDPAVALRDE